MPARRLVDREVLRHPAVASREGAGEVLFVHAGLHPSLALFRSLEGLECARRVVHRGLLEVGEPQAVADELDGCRALLGTGRASIDLGEIVLASSEGRVGQLFVARGAQRWGAIDLEARRVEPGGEPAEELLNLAAGLTVGAGGRVRSVAREHIPEQADAAAIFRF